MTYFFSNVQVIVCIENWGNRFSTFRYVHDVDPFQEYNHVATQPNDDYVHLDCKNQNQQTKKLKTKKNLKLISGSSWKEMIF